MGSRSRCSPWPVARRALPRSRTIGNADVREATGLVRVEARSLLARLVDDGRLVQIGQKRGTRYLKKG